MILKIAYMKNYKKTIVSIVKELWYNIKLGLKTSQVKSKQTKNWFNVLIQEKRINPWKVFLDQFKSVLILILIGAALVSFFVGQSVDAIVILAIVVSNAILWFIQEYRAEKSIEALKKMASLKSRVIRNGKERLIDSKELVVWDILIFEAWDKIWADARIINSVSLETAEAALTGESLPVTKISTVIKNDVVIWDQKNMVFATTVVTKWRGKAIVTAIGMDTEIGKIAWMIQEAPEKQTHLQKDLDKMSKWIWAVILIICAVIFFTDITVWWNGIQEAFLAAIALSVAAIPEWLPAVVTISLWLGVKRLVKKNALMRKLSSVETLWSVDVICTDKTWTLTKNEMTVKKLFVNNEVIDVNGVWYNIDWKFSKASKNFLSLLEIWLLCNNSDIDGKNIIWDPTEVALLVSAMKWWVNRVLLEKKFKRVDELPFDSDRKMMSIVRRGTAKDSIYFPWQDKHDLFVFSKGAPELLLDKCDRILINGEIKKLTKKDKDRILKQNSEFAGNALRVLWFAYNTLHASQYDDMEKSGNRSLLEDGLVFVWLQAMIDPPRSEVKESIKQCKQAWIRVVMITWDNIVTAKAIANELGIKWDAMEWLELEWLSDKQIAKLIDGVWVFARVSPRHKQHIVKILQDKWHIVSMTWDGVNDAPALKYADIGLAMWITGTDVTKDASDMILMDDNFATIVHAIEEGRWIYDNIKKFVNYLFSTNFAEILIIFISTLIGLPLPLIAIQILWINLVTDGFPALALWVDTASPDIMKRKPRKKSSNIIDRDMIISIVWLSIAMTFGALYVFIQNYKIDLAQARSWVLVLLTIMELLRIRMIRDNYGLPFWSNKWFFGAVGTSIWLVLLVVYVPFLASVFKTVPLSGAIWAQIWVIFVILVWLWWITNRVKRYQINKK